MKLNDVEFDHVVRVNPDGTVSDEPNVYAPELFDERVSDGWELLDGYSGQYGYSGPIMHPSEYIGGRMERDILSEPGVYVALVAYGDKHEIVTSSLGSVQYCKYCGHGGCEESESYGWAVARKVED